jgi:uncharacterized protein YggE
MHSSVRTLAAGGLGALIVAVAAMSAHAGPAAAAPTASDPATHTISVSGTGKVTVVPDVARVNLGVTMNQPTVKAARASAAQSMTEIIAAIKALGVADADIQTTGLSLYPQYANGSTTRIAGYTISEQVQVTIRDLDKAGDVVDAATAKGATDVNGISFELADPAKTMNDARAAAITAARASAQAMASAGNVNLGAIVSMTDASVAQPYPVYFGNAAGAAPDAAVKTPVQVGTQDVSVVIQVVFAIG